MAKFPVKFDTCPTCGSTETIGMLGAKEVGLKADSANISLRQQIAVMQGATGITVPAIVCTFDICLSCGKEYCRTAELKHLPITAKLPGVPGNNPPPGFMPPGMGRG